MYIHCQSTGTRIKEYRCHSHSRWEVICQLEGEARIRVDEQSFFLKPHDILLIPPNASRSGISKEGFCDVALRADGIQFSALTQLHDTSGDIRLLLLMLRRIITEKKENHLTIAQSLVCSIVEMIRQEIGATTSPEVERMKRTLYENLSNADFDLAKAISKTGYSDDHFRRRFFEETGKTPLQYLTDLRITHAKQLLLSKESFSVSTVALGCGFADSFYFSTCFKKHVGCSPRAYQSRALAQPATPSSQSHVQAHHNQKADDEK